MITNIHNAISKILGQLKKIIKENKLIWDIQKNIEVEEKWDPKKEERVKEINVNNPFK